MRKFEAIITLTRPVKSNGDYDDVREICISFEAETLSQAYAIMNNLEYGYLDRIIMEVN